MITVINETNYWLYRDLFDRATNALHNNYKEYLEIEITTLSDYYKYLQDLVKIDSRFLMLPLDEQPCEVNLNERTINIPSWLLKTGIGIQGDCLAKMIMFQVPRFYEHMDLLECEICIQWNLNGEKGNISKIEIKNLIVKDGQQYIVFPWIISDKLTQESGVVNFSVRFFKKDNDTNNLIYNLNTLATSLNIYQTLQIAINDAEADISGSDLINTITNSSYSDIEPIQPARQPIFIEVPDKEIFILDDKSDVNLYVRAISEDAGKISYTWKKNNNILTKNIFTEKYKRIDKEEFDINEIYYIEIDEKTENYELYTGNSYPTDGSSLFIKTNWYAIERHQENIVGNYSITAKNTVGKNTNFSTYEFSIPEPVLPIINHPTTIFLEDDDSGIEANITQGIATDIQLDLEEENANQASLKCDWYFSTINEVSAAQKIHDDTSEDFKLSNVSNIGFYYFKITSTLNRMSLESELNNDNCIRVVKNPKIENVVLQYELNGNSVVDVNNSIESIKVNTNDSIIMMADANLYKHDGYSESLFTDNITYQWQSSTYSDFRDCAEDYSIGNEATLYQILESNLTSGMYYRCKITNQLGDKKQEAYSNIIRLYS